MRRTLLILGLSGGLGAGCAEKGIPVSRDRESPESERREAQRRFLAFRDRGFPKEAYRDVTIAFVNCFEKGDLVSRYSTILATARVTVEHPGGSTEYCWSIPLPYNPGAVDSSRRALIVAVDGDPPRIVGVYTADSID